MGHGRRDNHAPVLPAVTGLFFFILHNIPFAVSAGKINHQTRYPAFMERFMWLDCGLLQE